MVKEGLAHVAASGALVHADIVDIQRQDILQQAGIIRPLYIDDICVDKDARGRHVGKALFDHIRSFAMEKGCHNITLNVWTCNPGAMAFYGKLGLVPYKVGMEKIL